MSWGPIRLTGLHTVVWGEEPPRTIAINSPEEESNIESYDKISIGATSVEASGSSGVSFIQLWPWALGCVLAVLLAEWYVYQKKVGGFAGFKRRGVSG